jgi:hypothetical protein
MTGGVTRNDEVENKMTKVKMKIMHQEKAIRSIKGQKVYAHLEI